MIAQLNAHLSKQVLDYNAFQTEQLLIAACANKERNKFLSALP